MRPALAHALYEEFQGVLTGLAVERPWLSREEYLALGVRRSIFLEEDRAWVYDLFERYLAWLKTAGCYDPNVVAQHYLAEAPARYDFVVVDEVQDLTNVQLALALRTLRKPGRFLLCGDSNQVVHPNFFSWTQLKTLFFGAGVSAPGELLHVLRANYRNAAGVVGVANRLLRIKQLRFGSIDRESNYLVESVSEEPGTVELLPRRPGARRRARPQDPGLGPGRGDGAARRPASPRRASASARRSSSRCRKRRGSSTRA